MDGWLFVVFVWLDRGSLVFVLVVFVCIWVGLRFAVFHIQLNNQKSGKCAPWPFNRPHYCLSNGQGAFVSDFWLLSCICCSFRFCCCCDRCYFFLPYDVNEVE